MRLMWLEALAASFCIWIACVSGELTTSLIFDNKGCTKPAKSVSLRQDLGCTPQQDREHPVCEQDGMVYSVADCIEQYEALSSAFYVDWEWEPYLLVESFDNPHSDWAWCHGFLKHANAYRLDGPDPTCYVNHLNATITSSQIAFDNEMISYTAYDDSECQEMSSKKELSWSNVTSGRCFDGMRFSLGGPSQNMMKAVTTFDDSTCSKTPVKFTLTRGFDCLSGIPSLPSLGCGASGPALYSTVNCTDDYHNAITNTFGNNTPYFVVENFTSQSWCAGHDVLSVDVYIADDSCHANADDMTSFQVTAIANGFMEFTTYEDMTCDMVSNTTTLSKWEVLSQDCLGDWDEHKKRYSIGGFGTSGLTTSLVYDNDGCTTPAKSVSMRQDLGCTPQQDREHPECGQHGMIYSVADCMEKYEALSSAFYVDWDWQPYLLVESFDNPHWDRVWCNGLMDNANAYRLDGPDPTCYANYLNTSTPSSLIAFDNGMMVYTAYGDSDCQDITSKIELSWSDATSGHCFDGLRFSLRGPSQSMMKAVTIFDERTCSEAPVKLIFTHSFDCITPSLSNSECGAAGPAHYSITNCTEDYHRAIMDTFGNYTPYFVVENFIGDDSTCDWDQVQGVAVYIADGFCHYNADDMTSFRVTVLANSSIEFTTFEDTTCSMVSNTTTLSKREILSQHCMHEGGGHKKRYSIGGFGTSALTTSLIYDNDGCMKRAKSVSMRQDLGCTPQKDREHPVCEPNGIVYSVADCMEEYEALSSAFYVDWEWESYLLVETFHPHSWCYGLIEYVNAYRLDGRDTTCYANHLNATTTSSQIAFDNDNLIYTAYDDSECQETSSKIELSWSDATSGRFCLDGMRFSVGGLSQNMTKMVTIFDESTCSDVPVKLTFTQSFDCISGIPSFSSSDCRVEGPAHYSITNCTDDYHSAITNTFGNNTPYFVVENFGHSGCYWDNVPGVEVYIADGLCHANADDMTSFQVTIMANSSIEFTTYEDTACSMVSNTTTLSKREILSQDCMGEWDDKKRYSVGGFDSLPLTGKTGIVLGFDGGSCNGIPVQVKVANDPVCTASSSCGKVSSARYQYQDCVYDVVAHTKSLFGSTPHLIMEKYVVGTDCRTLANTIIYRVDGKCHPSFTGDTFFRITSSLVDSLTIATYPTSSCSDFDAEYITVGTKYINTDVCYDGKVRLYANTTAPSTQLNPTVPMMDVDSMTREQIMFPEWLWEPKPRRVFETD